MGLKSSSPLMFTMPVLTSLDIMELAMNMRRYVISRAPNDFIVKPSPPPPLETPPAPLPLPSAPTSGTTTSVPVATILSPALACSTWAWRTMTSMVRGKLPPGTSPGSSWTLMRCQSTNTLSSRTRLHALRLPHVVLVQMMGSVYLNCCWMLRTVVEQSRQRKAPKYSSGRTSLVRVTVPVKLDSTPTFSTLKSRSLSHSIMLTMET
mmetsp:Transcript_1705/g.4288  ORF Transcript_1705/g.4288 Transcript_1705/m.4288 type:complete len:207 (+) Transcript_1705:1792-2412(+)